MQTFNISSDPDFFERAKLEVIGMMVLDLRRIDFELGDVKTRPLSVKQRVKHYRRTRI